MSLCSFCPLHPQAFASAMLFSLSGRLSIPLSSLINYFSTFLQDSVQPHSLYEALITALAQNTPGLSVWKGGHVTFLPPHISVAMPFLLNGVQQWTHIIFASPGWTPTSSGKESDFPWGNHLSLILSPASHLLSPAEYVWPRPTGTFRSPSQMYGSGVIRVTIQKWSTQEGSNVRGGQRTERVGEAETG